MQMYSIWDGSQLKAGEQKINWLRKKVLKCLRARDTARDPECQIIWNNHAQTLRARLRKELS